MPDISSLNLSLAFVGVVTVAVIAHLGLLFAGVQYEHRISQALVRVEKFGSIAVAVFFALAVRIS